MFKMIGTIITLVSLGIGIFEVVNIITNGTIFASASTLLSSMATGMISVFVLLICIGGILVGVFVFSLGGARHNYGGR